MDHLFKIIIIGSENVGKTCFLQRFSNQSYIGQYIPTIGVDFSIAVLRSSDGQSVKLQIWDTAGQERFRTISSAYYRGAHGIIIMYDTQNRKTFNELPYWLDMVEQMAPDKTSVIIVGHKADSDKPDREVSREEAQAFADARKIFFEEASSKDDINVKKIFQEITDMMVKNKKDNSVQQHINTGNRHGTSLSLTGKYEQPEKRKKKCFI